MFYNIKIKKITYYKIYFGPSYYKNFTKYILDVLKETKFKGEVINILAPPPRRPAGGGNILLIND
jgi:hypothetical protein